jgi:hypothetical protein
MDIFLATWTEDNQGETLTKVDYRNRLMSYYFLKEVKPEFLPEYVETGRISARKDKGGV